MSHASVECHSGYTYAQEPRVVVWEGMRYPVTEVSRRWRQPEGPAFDVETEQGVTFSLLYLEVRDCWTVEVLSGDPGSDGA